MRRLSIPVLVVLIASCLSIRADGDATSVLIDWVVQLGAVVKGEITQRPDGLRGLFATQDIDAGEDIMSVPETAIINGGSVSSTIMSPILTYLRELHTPCSRFRRYLDVLPSGEDIWNACTLPKEHVRLLQAPYWDTHIAGYQDHMYEAWSGQIRDSMEITFEDMLGDTAVSMREVQKACAVVTSRFFQNKRDRVVHIPVMDMANHWYQCTNDLEYAYNGTIKLVAGKALKKGDEICFGYGSMRDDYALFHYGFLPPEETPMRLLLVDHHDFQPDVPSKLSDEPFQGTANSTQAEVTRLQGILQSLGDAPPQPPAEGQGHPGLDLILQLRDRRVRSLKAEIARLSAVLAGDQETKAEL